MYDNMHVIFQIFSFSPIQFIRMYFLYSIRWIRQEGSANGITGPIDFDRDFKTRQNFHMEVIELNKSEKREFQKTAEWSARSGLIVTRTATDHQSQLNATIPKNIFKVVTRLDPPYLRKVDNFDNCKGNDRYEGFIKDLMDAIAKSNNFSYELIPEPSGSLGKYNLHSGKWDGVLGE